MLYVPPTTIRKTSLNQTGQPRPRPLTSKPTQDTSLSTITSQQTAKSIKNLTTKECRRRLRPQPQQHNIISNRYPAQNRLAQYFYDKYDEVICKLNRTIHF
jgi:hypothetical protein